MAASSLMPPLTSSRESSLEREVNPPNAKAVSSLLDTIPVHTWDDAAASLMEKGVATVRLSAPTTAAATASATSLQNIHSEAFRSARRALDRVLYRDNPTTEADEEFLSPLLPMIPPEADSAHVTGFHHAGGMSRYNVRREGIVFSDEECDWNAKDETNTSYLSDLSGMFWSLHGIADRVLLAIETKLELPSEDPLPLQPRDDPQGKEIDGQANSSFGQQPSGWFQRHLGPTATSSQWHMKRFVIGEEEEEEQQQEDRANESKDCAKPAAILRTERGERISLPMHTDPSLISVVVHDRHGGRIETNNRVKEGSTNEALGALGLQYFHPKKKQWEEPEAHGHLVATIFVGSVLAHLTCGKFPAAKHRVVETRSEEGPLPKRMAATLFVRPQPSALLKVPLPSPWLLQRLEEEEAQKNDTGSGSNAKKKKSFAKPPITFDAWLKRVAKNYEKQKKKHQNKSKKVT